MTLDDTKRDAEAVAFSVPFFSTVHIYTFYCILLVKINITNTELIWILASYEDLVSSISISAFFCTVGTCQGSFFKIYLYKNFVGNLKFTVHWRRSLTSTKQLILKNLSKGLPDDKWAVWLYHMNCFPNIEGNTSHF